MDGEYDLPSPDRYQVEIACELPKMRRSILVSLLTAHLTWSRRDIFLRRHVLRW